jgi:osmotically-inducible protein OsmY
MNWQHLFGDDTQAPAVFSWSTPENATLVADVERSLRATGYVAFRRVNVWAVPGGVELQSAGSTYHLKQLAQSAALSVSGVQEVHNELEVISIR